MLGRTPICDFACFRSLATTSLATAAPSGPTSTACFRAAARRWRLSRGARYLARNCFAFLCCSFALISEGFASPDSSSAARPRARRTARNAAKTTTRRDECDNAMVILLGNPANRSRPVGVPLLACPAVKAALLGKPAVAHMRQRRPCGLLVHSSSSGSALLFITSDSPRPRLRSPRGKSSPDDWRGPGRRARNWVAASRARSPRRGSRWWPRC